MRLFGTDRVRGKAGEFLDSFLAMRLAMAAGIYFKDKSIKIRLVDALFIKPMDFEMLNHIVDNKPLIVYETELKINSLASNIAYYYSQNGILKRIYSFGVDDHFSVQGSIDEILKDEGLDMESFYQKVKEIIDEKREN